MKSPVLFRSGDPSLDLILPASIRQQITDVMEAAEQTPVICHEGIRELWFIGDKGRTELRLLFLGTMRITISRVEFKYQRQGTMTRILELLKDFCLENGVQKIVMQSVATEPMLAFCRKNGFLPDSTASFHLRNEILGDYVLQIIHPTT
ncbi:MAG: hypothetical protein IJA20_08605 [Methanocorpusculum sp.]|nr:hypothetical protein [Methanocorpusculum sp.]